MANLSSYLPGGIDPAAVTITGGSINGTTIGASTPSTGAFTTFTSNGIDDNATSTAITIDSSQNVGIGTSSPSDKLSVSVASNSGSVSFLGGTQSSRSLKFTASNAGGFDNSAWEINQSADNSGSLLIFKTRNTERMRIDSSGRVGIGTSSPSTKVEISTSSETSVLRLTDTATIGSANRKVGGIEFYQNDASGGAGIGSSIESYHVNISGDTDLRFATGDNTERMRIDSSGNVLVGTTSNAPTTTAGIILGSNDKLHATRNGGVSGYFNRLTSDGGIVEFAKDGTTLGSIGVINSNNLFISGSVANHAGLQFGTNAVAPMRAGASVDNVIDLGSTTDRFDDVYATNGTIQTSDVNEKQDIEALSEAETRVAVAAKALLRKFRWKSMVRTKSHDARIHFGIIAQDLQAAFEAEGLDAGDYGMFTHSTWTDEETGEERSRMGVRYSELLAFIIAAI